MHHEGTSACRIRPSASATPIPEDFTEESLCCAKGELHVQKALRRFGLDAVLLKFRVTARRHRTLPQLLSFKYSQAVSTFHFHVTRECRGLILDEAADWRVVSMSYKKFFNYNERYADCIDWATASCHEKLDGSLITMYRYAGEWHVATSSVADASGPIDGGTSGTTFAMKFWEVWESRGYELPSEEDEVMCYTFELLTPENEIIVKLHDRRLVLHGVRNKVDLIEESPELHAEKYGWEVARAVPFFSIDEVVAAAASLNPAKGEGFVVCDANFRRVKVKSPQYVALAGLTLRDKNKMNRRRMLQVIKTNEGSEFLAYFPQWKPLYDELRPRYEEFIRRAEAYRSRLASEERADLEALDPTPSYADYSGAIASGNCGSIKEYYAGISSKTLEELMISGGLLTGLPETERSTPSKHNRVRVSGSKKSKRNNYVTVAYIGVGSKGRKEQREEEDIDQILRDIALMRSPKAKTKTKKQGPRKRGPKGRRKKGRKR